MAASLSRGGAHVVLVLAQQAREIVSLLDDHPETFVLVDDVERFADTETEDVLLQWFKDPRRRGGGLVVAGVAADMATTFRGLSVVARRSAQGVLLNPTSYADGDLLGVRLPSLWSGPAHAGRGVLVRGGEMTPVQVAVAD
jgi:S-DNA-T family DNA segregation ATPase FtsK/SpoIIIE